MNIQVYRASASSYQDSQFLAKEKRILEGIKGVKYLQSLQEADKDLPFVLITNTHTKIEDIATPILDRTILIVHPNSGFDNFKDEFIEENKIPIIIGNPIRANAVVEYTLSAIFQYFCPIPNHHHWSQSRSWPRKLLRDQRVTLIGHGHIGKILYSSLKPICREIQVFDPFTNKNVYPYVESQFVPDDFSKTDVFIIAANLNSSTNGLINKKILNQLSKDCLIINPARGEIVNEDDLINFLRKNPKAYAFLDVFEKEPFKPGYLNDLKNLNKTSHIAGVYEKLNSDILSFEYIVISEFLSAQEKNEYHKFENEYVECLLTKKSENYEPRLLK